MPENRAVRAVPGDTGARLADVMAPLFASSKEENNRNRIDTESKELLKAIYESLGLYGMAASVVNSVGVQTKEDLIHGGGIFRNRGPLKGVREKAYESKDKNLRIGYYVTVLQQFRHLDLQIQYLGGNFRVQSHGNGKWGEFEGNITPGCAGAIAKAYENPEVKKEQDSPDLTTLELKAVSESVSKKVNRQLTTAELNLLNEFVEEIKTQTRIARTYAAY